MCEAKTIPTPKTAPLPVCVGVFLGSVPFLEGCLRLANPSLSLFGVGLLRALCSGMALGALLWLISTCFSPKIGRWVSTAGFTLVGILFFAQICCLDFFGTYYQLGFLLRMSGQVAGNFLSSAVGVILRHLLLLPVVLAPAIVCAIWGDRLLVPAWKGVHRRRKHRLLFLAAGFVLLQLLALLLCHVGDDQRYFTTDYSANSAIPRVGLVNTLRLEAEYTLFGQPVEITAAEPATSVPEEESPSPSPDPVPEEAEPDAVPEESAAQEEPVEYGYNVTDLDLAALAESETDTTLKAMDAYFASIPATQQNEYTGLFEGKNLIILTAESFCPYVIDEERTPALYRLVNEGFHFTNYYQPDWSQSTTGGEFAVMTGLIPNWIGSSTAFAASAKNAMPYGLGWVFNGLGYHTTAYHNNGYSYYHRSETHPNLGYDYYGYGNGLELPSQELWPSSDLEMIQATVDDYISEYQTTCTPFHLYYMTVSGHCEYNFGNAMSKKNQAVVEGLDYGTPVLAYLACQMELEYAMEYLLDALEQSGIAEDTVIVLSADHYPYALTENYGNDYYQELSGKDDNANLTSRYENALILWCGDMEEPVEVDTPCSSLDIVPTLLNLFGVEYDSRLLSGKDIFAPDAEAGTVDAGMKIVLFTDQGFGNSWITAAGTYEAYTKTFTPNEGVTVSEDYVAQVSQLVTERVRYARYIVEQDYYRYLWG
jgi:lipoteichoic acid synthase